MTFIPNRTCQLAKRNGTDIYGQPVFLQATTVPCAVVNYSLKIAKTSVRADTSATRGHAEEEEAVVRLLFPAVVNIAIGDQVTLDTISLKVMTAFPQSNVQGQIDHIQADLTLWEDE